MVKVRFVTSDGNTSEAEAAAGDNLLRVAQNAGMPLEGTCEGQMACSTCHVIVAPEWFGKLPEASEEEEDMLDQAFFVKSNSRLGCQIKISESLDGLVVRLAPEDEEA